MERSVVLQIIDANLNRLREGIRVIEEFTRYEPALNAIFNAIRKVRRDCGEIESSLRARLQPELALSRKIHLDAGAIETRGNKLRTSNLTALIPPNFKRAQESARNLEEYLKFIGETEESATFRRIRFRLYEIEEKLNHAIESGRRSELNRQRLYGSLKNLPICLILSEENTRFLKPLDLAGRFYRHGGRLLQIRLKNRSAKECARLTFELKGRFPQMVVIINDRADIAISAGADGVHLGDEDLSISAVRQLSEKLIVGKTVRNLSSARLAIREGADYLGVGSIFKSPTKPSAKVVGIDTLKKISSYFDKPVLAIGGIDLHNFAEVLSAGASALSVISAVASDAKASAFFSAVRKYWKKR